MAIQMRRGLRKDFDPNKMLPGEWAVSIDSVTSNQIVWMCFAAGICKRMGTYEDFQAQIAEATKDIRDSYVEDFNEIKADIELMSNAVSSDKEEILIIKSDIVDKYLPQMQEYAERAEGAASSSETSASNAENSATLSKSYAVGGTGTREGENADNAKYYYEQAKHISQGGNGLVPMGTIAFEDIPTSDIATNAMYNISNDFTSDERFVDGGGVLYGKGSNIFYTVDGLWDVLAASDVKGVKGAAEDTYRQGNVNITPANIGSPTSEEFNELSDTVGDTDISDVAGGTVTSAIRELVDNPSDTSIWISQADYNDKLSDEEKDSDTSYYIYDADSNDNAYTLPFTSEKYEAENAGDALNEIKADVEEISSNLEDLRVTTLGSNIYLTANTPYTFNANSKAKTLVYFFCRVNSILVTGITLLSTSGRIYVTPDAYIDFTYNVSTGVWVFTSNVNMSITSMFTNS